jgi:hypothetical protein
LNDESYSGDDPSIDLDSISPKLSAFVRKDPSLFKLSRESRLQHSNSNGNVPKTKPKSESESDRAPSPISIRRVRGTNQTPEIVKGAFESRRTRNPKAAGAAPRANVPTSILSSIEKMKFDLLSYTIPDENPNRESDVSKSRSGSRSREVSSWSSDEDLSERYEYNQWNSARRMSLDLEHEVSDWSEDSTNSDFEILVEDIERLALTLNDAGVENPLDRALTIVRNLTHPSESLGSLIEHLSTFYEESVSENEPMALNSQLSVENLSANSNPSNRRRIATLFRSAPESVHVESLAKQWFSVVAALIEGDSPTLRKLLVQNPNLLSMRDNAGRSLLHIAAHNVPSLCPLLVELGVDARATDM